MENALFYTFSTIAQTLAAAIALLGAFTLYRLQTIGALLDDLALTAMQPYLPDDTARRLRAEENYGAFLEHLRNTQSRKTNETIDPVPTAALHRLGAYVQALSSLQGLLKWALGLTVVVIIAAVTILALTPQIATQPSLACVVFILGIGSFAGCLVVYSVLVVRSLQ